MCINILTVNTDIQTYWEIKLQFCNCYSLLFKACYQPVIENVLLWFPCAVPKKQRDCNWLVGVEVRFKSANFFWPPKEGSQAGRLFHRSGTQKRWLGVLIKKVTTLQCPDAITYFNAHPFHFTRYSMRACNSKGTEESTNSTTLLTLHRSFSSHQS